MADLQARARKLAAQITAQGEKISVLAEQYDQAVIDSQRADADLASARTREAAAADAAEAARENVRRSAVEAYVRGSSVEAAPSPKDIQEAVIGQRYVRTAIATEQHAVDTLRAAQLALEEERTRLQQATDAAHLSVDHVDSQRKAAEAAVASQQKLLDGVQGDLAVAVAAEQQRQAEEQAAEAARTQAAQAAAAAEAARRTTTTARSAQRPAPTAPAPPPTPATVPPRTSPPGGGSPPPTAPPSTRPPATRPPTTTAPVGPAPPVSGSASVAVETARQQLGKPYVWGGSGPDSFDCSGLTAYAWRAAGRYLPHSSAAQFSMLPRVSVSDVRPGDLIFFGSPVHHVGIYVGGGQMIEAPYTGANVRYASAFRSDMVGIGRP